MLNDWRIDRLDALYDRMERDFPSNERPSRNRIKKTIQTGSLKAYSLDLPEQAEAAYALTAGNGAVLVTHLAVNEAHRGMGYGTKLLDALREKHSDHDLLIVEVERPSDAKDEAEKQLREKRIAFYLRAGFEKHETLPYKIFGVPMMLMTMPLKQKAHVEDEALKQMIKAAYREILPAVLMGQVSFK